MITRARSSRPHQLHYTAALPQDVLAYMADRAMLTKASRALSRTAQLLSVGCRLVHAYQTKMGFEDIQLIAVKNYRYVTTNDLEKYFYSSTSEDSAGSNTGLYTLELALELVLTYVAA